MPKPRYEYVRIGLPLPLTVVGALGDLIEKAWPNSTIITDPHRAEGVPWEVANAWHRGELLLQIDVSKPAKRISRRAAQKVADQHQAAAEDTEVGFGGFDADGAVRLSPPEELTAALEPIIAGVLDTEGVVNYLSWEVVGRPDGDLAGKRAFISVSHSKGQTPHECHMAEKESNAQLRAALHVALAYARGEHQDEEAMAGAQIALDEANARAD